jgi:UDP-2-acetamido-3-amino-2,3-dideoxy-glucuronate N-acetyltransferase
MMKRIFLIGVGRWGANHLRVLKSMPIELYVADCHDQRLSSADVPKSHRSTDAGSLFSKVDAAVIVTPAPTHFDMCRELLQMGKDVFVEKPISLVSSEAKEMTELAQRPHSAGWAYFSVRSSIAVDARCDCRRAIWPT